MRTRLPAILAASIVLAPSVLFSACGEVPAIRFGEAGVDAGASDAKPDRASIDGAVEASTCPDGVPALAKGCCGAIPCVGQNCSSVCGNKNCSTCTSAEFCCTKGPGSCITPGLQCD